MKITIVIEQEVDVLGNRKPVAVTGPLHDKVLCYGLLEAARDAICEFHLKNASPVLGGVVVPPVKGRG